VFKERESGRDHRQEESRICPFEFYASSQLSNATQTVRKQEGDRHACIVEATLAAVDGGSLVGSLRSSSVIGRGPGPGCVAWGRFVVARCLIL
jgi:hypothetical protein